MHLEVELTKPPRWNCRYFVQLSYSSFTIRTGRTLVLAKAIDWHIALTQAGPKFMSPHEFAAFKQNLLIKRVQLYNANSFAPPFSQCLLEMLFFFNQSFSSFWRHVARLLEWFLFERGCLSADGGSSLCSFARGRLSSPDHGRVEAIVTAAWPNWQSPLTTKKKDPFWKGQWAKHRITALVNKYKLWILGAFLRSEPEISLSFRSSFSSKLGTVYSPTSRIFRDGCLHVTWPDLAHCLQHEVGGKMVGVWNMGWSCKFVKRLESALFVHARRLTPWLREPCYCT